MASHFQCLGFEIKNQYEFKDLIRLTAKNSTPLYTNEGVYLPWKIGNGIELWAQLNKDMHLCGLNPHFSGETTQIIGLSEIFPRSGLQLDGSFQGWVNPEIDQSYEPPEVFGDYPLVFDSPAFTWLQHLKLPIIARVQLAAFAYDLEVSKYGQRIPSIDFGTAQLANEFFIPTGTFQESEDKNPEAEVYFGGTVLSSQSLVNLVSQKNYTMATVRTYGMDIDVLIAQETISQQLLPGQVVRGYFWLSGMIKEIIETYDTQDTISHERFFSEVNIAGIQYQHVDELVDTLAFGACLHLEREPENQYDRNAIAIYAKDHVKLGYIPRDENSVLARIMDRGVQPVAYISDKYVDSKYIESFTCIAIRIYLPPKQHGGE